MIRKPVEKSKMLFLVSLLSDFDFFRVNVSNGSEFYATRVRDKQDYFLVFERQFATSIYANERIIDIQAISDTEFICRAENNTYTINALHRKPDAVAAHVDRQYKDIVDLMDVSFIGNRFVSYMKELDLMFLVVDPYCLGELTIKEAAQIEKIINVNLKGSGKSMQMCRTICFQVKMNGGRNQIYAGIYDLEHGVSVTSEFLYEERMKELVSDEFYDKCCGLIEYANNCFKEGNFI